MRLVVPTAMSSLALLVTAFGAIQAKDGAMAGVPLILTGLVLVAAAGLVTLKMRPPERVSAFRKPDGGGNQLVASDGYRIYRIPVGAVLGFWTGFVLTTLMFCACIAYLLLFRAFIQAGVLALAWLSLFFIVVLPSLTVVRRVDVTSAGLSTTTTLGLRRSVAWEEIVSVREREPNRLYRSYALLELLDQEGKVRARLNSRLSDYEQLKTSIDRRVFRPGSPATGSAV